MGGHGRRHQRAADPLISGSLLLFLPWSSVFLVVIPVALVALFLVLKYIPAHVNESTEPVDNLGGILSMVLVGTFILAINFAPVPSMRTLVLGLVGRRGGGPGPLRHPPAAGQEPAL